MDEFPDIIKGYDIGTDIILDTGQVLKSITSQKEVMRIIDTSEDSNFIYFAPRWRIDEEDYLAVQKSRIVATRSIRDLEGLN